MTKQHISPWKKIFILIYSGQAFSIIGSSAVQFSIIWWLTVNTGSAITLTVATIVGFLPTALIGPFAGVWVDRYNRKVVMMLADSFVALSSAALALGFLLFGPSVSFIYVILFLRGVGNTFHSPAMQAAIPMLVPPEHLVKANGWGQFIASGCNMIGPVFGAAMIAFLPLPAIMLVDVVGAVAAVGTLIFVHVPDIPRQSVSAQKPTMIEDLKAGFGAIRDNKMLIAISIPVLFSCIAYMPLTSLFPLLIRNHFAGNEWHTSFVQLLFATGLLASSVFLGIFGRNRKQFAIISLAMAGLGVAVFLGGLLSPQWFFLFAALAFCMGCASTFISTPYMAFIQRSVPPEVMGKVISLGVSLMGMAMPIGLLAAGPGSELLGVDGWFILSGCMLILIGIASYFMTRKYED